MCVVSDGRAATPQGYTIPRQTPQAISSEKRADLCKYAIRVKKTGVGTNPFGLSCPSWFLFRSCRDNPPWLSFVSIRTGAEACPYSTKPPLIYSHTKKPGGRSPPVVVASGKDANVLRAARRCGAASSRPPSRHRPQDHRPLCRNRRAGERRPHREARDSSGSST